MKNKIRIITLILALTSLLLATSCSGEKSGNFTSESTVSKSGYDNDVQKSEAAIFTKDYYNWVYAEAFADFSKSVEVIQFPQLIDDAIKTLPENKRVSFLSNIFLPSEVSATVLTAYEYEINKDKYTHNVTFASKRSEGVYEMKIKFQVGSETPEQRFMLNLSSKTRGISLEKMDESGNVTDIYEIVISNDGYVAVNKLALKDGKWTAFQLMFKGGENPVGYCSYVTDAEFQPVGIYEKTIYAGFAGKN